MGRRKTSVARVRLYMQGKKEIIINDQVLSEYFPYTNHQLKVKEPLEKMKITDNFKITVLVKGGGIDSQAEAVRHGITRALVEYTPEYRKKLRKAGLLTRDSRMKERKKFGLKRARKAPQWSKR